MNIKKIILREDKTIKDALIKISENSTGSCIIINKNGKLVGIVTDGDIRKLSIKNISLNSKIKNFCNRKVKYLLANSSTQKIISTLSNKIKIIPLIDDNKKVIDFSTINHLREVPISEPYIFGKEYSYVKHCLDNNWISSKGNFVLKFEKIFSKYMNRSSLAVSSGTAALELAIKSLNLKKNDEIILPVLTFAAPANAIINCGCRPVFIDVKKNSYQIDVDQIKKKINKKTKAIIAVHLYGEMCEIKKIAKIAKENNIFLIEDCAEAIGSSLNKKLAGEFSDISTFSFFGNKTITTGEGGMACFKSKKHLARAEMIRNHGMNTEKKYWHNIVGSNYRLTNLQAAVGCAQLENIDKIINKKIKLAKKYIKNFADSKKIEVVKIKKNIKNTYWLFCIFFKDFNSEKRRDKIIQQLNFTGIETRPVFYPLNMMKIYKKYCAIENFPNAKKISLNSITLPTSYSLSVKEINRISNKVKKITENV